MAGEHGTRSSEREAPIPIKTNMYKADGGIWLISSGYIVIVSLQVLGESVTFDVAADGKSRVVPFTALSMPFACVAVQNRLT